ncbi:MAG TPA: helix-turn-helix domain-containing protein [Candidatus Ratteibacteria bacterium]|nr:helix-turn-helix domain-containing protein [Candidatus Ratteibacteria bacterium]
MEKKFSTWSVIPTEVMLNKEISSTTKIMYGIISSLCNEKGYCWASNDYLGELLGITRTRVSLIIKELVEIGLIESEIEKKYKRKIKLKGVLIKVKRGVKENLKGGLRKLKDNNIIEYNNNNNINNIYNKNKKYYFRGNRCRIDNFSGKWKCFENGEWLEIADGYEKEIIEK